MKYTEIPIQVEGSGEGVKLETYLLDTPTEKIRIKKRPMIVICPGGGYGKLSYREGEPIALHFMNQGYHACVLRYSIAPARYPAALLELGTVMKILNVHAQEWNVDAERIILLGSSAGAHLAASLGVFWNKEWLFKKLDTTAEVLKPAGMILSYPVITSDAKLGHLPSFHNLLGEQFEELKDEVSIEKQVSKDTPATFLWHTMSDQTVPVENSFLMAAALKKAGVSAELHVFPKGEHGLSLASPNVERADGSGLQKQCEAWIDLADTWLESLWEV